MPMNNTAYKHNLLQQLRGFCYTARFLSMSRAAERMYLSQPSVSLQIKALERELNATLFERHGPRLVLTRDGETLLELARPLVEGIDRLPDVFQSRRDTAERGTVSIAAGGSTIQYILPRYIDAFVHQHPQVDVRLHNVTGRAGLALLRGGEVDLAVGPMLDAPPDIAFYPVVSYEPVLITAREHPLVKRKRVTLRDISQYPFIMPPRNQSTSRSVEMVLAEHSLEYDVKLEVGGYDVIKRYVALGLGIAIVMSHCLTESDPLHTVPMGRYFPRRSYGVVLLKGRRTPPAVTRFIQTLCPDFQPSTA